MGNPITTVEESNKRLEREDNYANSVEVRKLHDDGRGRKHGRKALSPMMRNLIGATAKTDGISNAAKAFGVNPRSVSNYSKGRSSHKQPLDRKAVAGVQKNVDALQAKREKIVSGSYDRIASLFDEDGPVNSENMKALKPREAVSVAKDLATVVDKITPKSSQDKDQRVQVVVFAPRVKEEDEYETIDVEARVID